ncbi:group XV phospholipase A2 [Eurytemora carolleeae]|uniref:group XV phospholipase A2 n=1 Tax=Eurytemora carolleeae TaxID=1294199 RepID=UPI000C787D06|nr:group XV phospholipase A2 [Eurytemora carolleeae]|eukprot:XP_023340781.1 group XV phospholipase A2-like [Eurytemora affinis]
MKDMVEYFVSQGYVRGESIRAAPYDFRFAPHSQVEYFNELKNLIEDTSRRNNNKPVSIVSHSMGGLFGLHFLQSQDKDWLDRYISRFIPMNCPWIGATLQLITYASGYNMDISVISPLVIREEQRSYETGVYLLPNPHKWENLDQVLVHTPHRNYTVRNYPTFFNDIGYPQGQAMMDDVVNITRLEHPGVKTTCIYSVGVPTPVGLEYSDGFPDTQPTRIKGDGDGSVTVNSLAYCSRFLNNPGDRSMVFRGLDHGQILKTTEVLEFIKSQLVI